MRFKNWKWALSILLIIAVDQLVKYLVINNLSQVDSVTVIPRVFSLIYVKNTGAAFSIFSDKTAALGVISIIFSIAVIAYWYVKKPESTLLKMSLALLLAGALGNAVDRITRGFVVDFIEATFIRFPVFNIADIAITFGTIFLMIYLLFFDKDGTKNGEITN